MVTKVAMAVLLSTLPPALAFGGGGAGVNRIEIFTKEAQPMSMTTDAGTVGGYSIDFWINHVAPILGVTDVRVTMLSDNNAIMGAVHCHDELVQLAS